MKKIIIKKKKLFLISSLFCLLVIISLFTFYYNITYLSTNAYNIVSIYKNIDKIQVGDKIYYSANGVDDWVVLSVNKSDETIEIIPTKPVENYKITDYNSINSQSQSMNQIANKYISGKYAINARNLIKSDLSSGITNYIKGCSWVDNIFSGYKKGTTLERYIYGSYICSASSDNRETKTTTLVASTEQAATHFILKLEKNNTDNYSVGDNYPFSSNGISDWVVFKNDDDKYIEIINKNAYELDYVNGEITKNFNDYISNLLRMFSNDSNIEDARIPTSNDINQLMNANIKNNYSNILISDGSMSIEYHESSTNYADGLSYPSGYTNYNIPAIQYASYKNTYQTSNINVDYYTKTYGVLPVVTIKYPYSVDNIKEKTTNIKIGDKVKYTNNSYNKWKVLSIDKNKKTAEIISSGLVSYLTLTGEEDYNNYEQIINDQIEKYKNNKTISVRIPTLNDIYSLNLINDNLSKEYWLNDKKIYKNQTSIGTKFDDYSYGIAIASYQNNTFAVTRSFVPLEVRLDNENAVLSSKPAGKYRYKAGIRPIITVNLNEIEKENFIKNNVATEKENSTNSNISNIDSNSTVKYQQISKTTKKDNDLNIVTISENNNLTIEDTEEKLCERKDSDIIEEKIETKPKQKINTIQVVIIISSGILIGIVLMLLILLGKINNKR